MDKVKNIIYIALFLCLVLLIWSAVSSLAKPAEIHAGLTDGVLDLSGVDINRAIFSCEDFESYPQKLYTPQDFADGIVTEQPQYLKLEDYRHIDYATHRIRVKIKPGRVYGVFLRSADYAMRLFIDGEETEPVGWPGDTKESTIPRVAERVYYFKPDAEIVTIIMQASNFVHREGAYPSLLRFGTYENITRFTMIELVSAILITGCLLTASLYHFGLFCLNRSRKNVFVFSLCCLLLAMMNNKLIPLLIPAYNWYIVFQLEYLVHFATFGMLAFFMDLLRPALFNKIIMRVYYVICAAYVFLTFILDTKVYSALILYFEAVSVLFIAYMIIQMALPLKAKLADGLSFVGVVVVALFGINDMLFHMGITLVGNIGGLAFTTPVAMVFFVFCHSLVLSIENAEKERILAEENTMLDKLSKMRAEFMAGISHEMKMPLTVMSGYAQLTGAMLDRGLNNADMRSNLNRITEEAEQLAKLVGQLLHVTRIQENKANLCLTAMAEIVRRTAESYEEMLAVNGNRLTLDIASDIPPVMADEVMLMQVLRNLLDNANAHTFNGTIHIKVTHETHIVCVCLSDNGEGIAPEFLPQVFERYKTKKENGTGLGLAICKEIISLHGGEITVESEPGIGTTVLFTLPKGGRAGE